MNRRTFLKGLAAAAASLTIKHKPQETPIPPAPTTITTGSVVDVRQLYNQNFQLASSYEPIDRYDQFIKWSEYGNPVAKSYVLRAKPLELEEIGTYGGITWLENL